MLRRYDFSLMKVLAAHPDGCSDRLISQALGIPEAEVRAIYERIVQKLRDNLQIN